ncbi:sulfurtransferase TusA family protein [Thiotrichales bacterium 19S11-10]|nr:sulfurtransferase TusA family protein [Thiotrichales bacterium 19S11-10]MCF6807850.1 sulfurtransferase TusA family protein [Thiotrichales bacterium 19S9-11]MCF6811864.1 sulfurtransferase TusA family protein [Thiotrichales bacterium 19S9-12]
MAESYDVLLDLKGLSCPLPILKAKKQLKKMIKGEVLKVLATDPTALEDFKAFARQSGHHILDIKNIDQILIFLIQKG